QRIHPRRGRACPGHPRLACLKPCCSAQFRRPSAIAHVSLPRGIGTLVFADKDSGHRHVLARAGFLTRSSSMLQTLKAPGNTFDFNKSRRRTFVERLIALGEVVAHEEPIALAALSAAIASTPKAVLFKDAGPEHFEIIAAVSGSRRRLAAAFGVDE